MSRRWLLGVTASRSREQGYLTDPYKMVSLLDPATGLPDAAVNESGPKPRHATMCSPAPCSIAIETSVPQLSLLLGRLGRAFPHASTSGCVTTSPTIGGCSRTFFYEQTRAQFFVFGLIHGPPLPAFASARTTGSAGCAP